MYVFESEVYFHCQNTMFSETCLDAISSLWMPELLLDLSETEDEREVETRNFTSMCHRMLEIYTSKVLTYQGDILNAITGISRRISTMSKSPWVEGIPAAAFDFFLLFTFSHPSTCRRRAGFPSYSWVGWIGSINFRENAFRTDETSTKWLREKTWIVWYKRSPKGKITPVWSPDPATNNGLKYWHDGRRLSFPFTDSLGTRHATDWRTRPSKRLPSINDLPTYPLLQFWTVSVPLAISKFDVFKGKATLVDRRRRECGYFHLDGLEDFATFNTVEPLEFALLSSAGVSLDVSNETWYDGSVTMFYIMCVEWLGGFAERRGLGIMTASALEHSFGPGATWKEFLLA